MSEVVQEQRACCICGGPATKTVKLGPWVLDFCSMDYTIARQGVMNLAKIKEILHQQGIHIGVPRGG